MQSYEQNAQVGFECNW